MSTETESAILELARVLEESLTATPTALGDGDSVVDAIYAVAVSIDRLAQSVERIAYRPLAT